MSNAKDLTHSQFIKAELFAELHNSPLIFVVANPWDVGSAKILTKMGYSALATSSAGLAFSLGKPDGQRILERAEVLEHLWSIVEATDLPVTADLENGYGDSPERCAETIMLASETGIVGGSIEDATGHKDRPIFDFSHSVERIIASVEAVRTLPFRFTLTARAENYLHSKPNLDDTIRRLTAYADAGADVLFAPGVKSKDDIKEIVAAVAPRPVNVLMGFPDSDISINDLAQIGVRRVSVGSSFARLAYGSFFNAALEVKQKGTFAYGRNADSLPLSELNAMFSED